MANLSPAGLILLAMAVLSAGCAPTFSEMQSARLAGPDRVEWTPGISSVGWHGEDESEPAQFHVGLQMATGVSHRVDLRARYERIQARQSGGGGVNIFGLGPKVGLVPDQLALNLPVGFAFGSGVTTGRSLSFHPTLLGTHPLMDAVELNGSAKLLIPVGNLEDSDILGAMNIGLGISSAPDRWILRPEAGILFNPGESGHFRQVSLGFTFYTGR